MTHLEATLLNKAIVWLPSKLWYVSEGTLGGLTSLNCWWRCRCPGLGPSWGSLPLSAEPFITQPLFVLTWQTSHSRTGVCWTCWRGEAGSTQNHFLLTLVGQMGQPYKDIRCRDVLAKGARMGFRGHAVSSGKLSLLGLCFSICSHSKYYWSPTVRALLRLRRTDR